MALTDQLLLTISMVVSVGLQTSLLDFILPTFSNVDTFIFYSHLVSLAIAAGGILYADSLGMKWIRGKIERLDVLDLERAHLIVSIALLLLVITGGIMFWPMRSYLLFQPLFLLKMAFVLLLILNSFVIDSMMHLSRLHSFRDLAQRQKISLFVSGAVSTVCWLGAGITALILFFPF